MGCGCNGGAKKVAPIKRETTNTNSNTVRSSNVRSTTTSNGRRIIRRRAYN